MKQNRLGSLLLVVMSGCTTVAPGHMGLMFSPISGLQKEKLGPGLYFTGIFSHIEDFDITYSTRREDIETTSSEGLHMSLKVAVSFRPVITDLYDLDADIGLNYYDEVIGPEFRSAARGVFAHHPYQELLKKNEQVYLLWIYKEQKKELGWMMKKRKIGTAERMSAEIRPSAESARILRRILMRRRMTSVRFCRISVRLPPEPETIETEVMKTLAALLGKLKQSKEDSGTLLDRTTVFLGSNLGDASSHSTKNLPVLVAGGGFHHGQHLAFDTQHNYPLPNLFVSMLQRMGLETDKFASATGTMRGLEMA